MRPGWLPFMPRKPHFVLAPREGGALRQSAAAAAHEADECIDAEWRRTVLCVAGQARRRSCVRLPRRIESGTIIPERRTPVNTVPQGSHLVRRIDETSGVFRVSFSDLAAWYHTTAPDLQQTIRAAHAAKREVCFSANRLCEILSVTMQPPRGRAQRLADQLRETCGGLVDVITRRNTRWIRDARRAARTAVADRK